MGERIFTTEEGQSLDGGDPGFATKMGTSLKTHRIIDLTLLSMSEATEEKM